MTEVYRRKPQPPDWPKPLSIVTREIDVSSGLLQTPYCPRSLVISEFYISGTEPTRDCDKHLAYGTPGFGGVIDTTPLPLPTSPPPSRSQTPINSSPPITQPGYEPVPNRNPPAQRRPTVFDTTRRSPVRDSTPRTDTSPAAPPPPR
jgi:penicillin-binding protein 1A